MKVGTELEYVELEELERLPENDHCAGHVRLLITLEFHGFRGSNDIWVELSEVEQFIEALEVLDAERQGTASISSISPDDFLLEVRSFDLAGHIEMEAALRRYGGSACRSTRLTGGCEMDPAAIRQLLGFFSALVE